MKSHSSRARSECAVGTPGSTATLGWVLDGVETAEELWQAEARWWLRVEDMLKQCSALAAAADHSPRTQAAPEAVVRPGLHTQRKLKTHRSGPGGEPGNPAVSDAGDLGRRIASRRTARRLTRQQLGRRAGISPAFIEYLETQAESIVGLSAATLLRLADALQTTPEELAGGGRDRPPGQGAPGMRPRLTAMRREECLRRLAPGGVGRVVFQAGDELLALPVNFRVVDGDIVFRTAEGGPLTHVVAAKLASFEVDHLDEASGEGWSVLAQGSGRLVSAPDEKARLEQAHIKPWPGGARPVFIRFEPSRLSGRRIRTSW